MCVYIIIYIYIKNTYEVHVLPMLLWGSSGFPPTSQKTSWWWFGIARCEWVCGGALWQTGIPSTVYSHYTHSVPRISQLLKINRQIVYMWQILGLWCYRKKNSVHFKLKVNLNRQQITHSNIEQYVYCFSIAYIFKKISFPLLLFYSRKFTKPI